MKPHHLLLTALIASSAAAQQAADPELDRLTSAFRQQREDAQRSAIAAYADQVRGLQADLEKKGDSAGAEKARQEFRSVMAKLDSLAAPKAAAAAAAGTPADPPPGLPKPTAKEDDLDSIFGTAKEKEPKPDAPEADAGKGRDGVVVLRAKDAVANPPGKPNRAFWTTGAGLTWTLENVPPGSYRVRLVFAAASGEAGGKGEIVVGGSPVPFAIKPPHDNWDAAAVREVAVLEIQKCPLDFAVRCVGLAEGARTLFELRRVDLIPEGANVPPVPAASDAPAQPKMERKSERKPEPMPEKEKPKKGIEF